MNDFKNIKLPRFGEQGLVPFRFYDKTPSEKFGIRNTWICYLPLGPDNWHEHILTGLIRNYIWETNFL